MFWYTRYDIYRFDAVLSGRQGYDREHCTMWSGRAVAVNADLAEALEDGLTLVS